MKKIIRLTESDLIRLVKRIINEGQESFDIVPLTIQNAGTAMILDGNGRNIFSRLSVYGSNEIILNAREGINFEEGEKITSTITFNPIWLVTGEVLENNNNYQTNFDSQTKKFTFTFNIPNERILKQSFFPEIVLRCNNIEGGKIKINVLLPKTTVIPTAKTTTSGTPPPPIGNAPSGTQPSELSRPELSRPQTRDYDSSMFESYKRRYYRKNNRRD